MAKFRFPFRFRRKPKNQTPPVLDTSRLATTDDINNLREEIRNINRTAEQQQEYKYYKKWMSMKPDERKKLWNKLNPKQQALLEKIVRTYKTEQEVAQKDGKNTRKTTH
jgi:hypothetical protein